MRVHPIVACLLLFARVPLAFAEDPFDAMDEESLSEGFIEDREETLLDLNAASVSDLAALLSRPDAERIVTFRKMHGRFRSPRDLARIDGLPGPVVQALLPHVTVGRSDRAEITSRLRLIRRSSAGGTFLTGAGLRSRTTYRFNDLIDAAVTTDKDPGERSPFDFAAGFAEVRPTHGDARLVIGDFRPGFAQGLVLNRWSRTPVALDQALRQPSQQVGYRSTDENGALRGVYLEGLKGPYRVAAFGASTRFDAAQDDSGQVERLVDEGLHVTPLERSRADALRERALGLRVERAAASGWRAGITALRARFTPPFKRQEGAARSGPSALTIGLDAGVRHRGLEVAGEVARTGQALACIAGTTLERRRLRAGLLVRDYDPGFSTLHGAGFSAFGESGNERGVFAGLGYKGRRIRRADITLDRAVHPGATATLPAGATRSSLTISLQHAPLHGVRLRWSGRARWDQTWKGKALGVVPRRRQSLRLDVERPLTRGLRVQARGEAVHTTLGGAAEAGGSAFGGVEVRWKGVRAEGRLTYFDLPSYESRLYEWEDAPEGMMALRTLTGRGLKGYGTLALKMGVCDGTWRIWRQRPLDGRRPTTEFLFQVEVRM